MKREELIERILGASNPAPNQIEVEGLGAVYTRVMTAHAAELMRKKLDTLPKDDGCYVGRMLAFVLCDEAGELLFDAADAETALKLSKLPPRAQQKVMQAANEATSGNA